MLQKRMTQPEIDILMAQLQGPDEDLSREAAEKLILGSQYLAYYLAHRNAAKWRLDLEEAIGTALLMLVQCVARAKDPTFQHTNFGAYLTKRITGAMLDMLADYSLVRNKQRKESASFSRSDTGDFEVPFTPKRDLWFEVEQSKFFTSRQILILKMLYAGFTRREISKILGINVLTVARDIDQVSLFIRAVI